MTSTAADLGLMTGTPPATGQRVTLTNWLAAPYNRWSFQHVRELIPTAPIPASRTPWPLPEHPVDLDDWPIDAAGQPTTVRELLDRTYTDGVAVLHRGRLIYQRYANAMTPATVHLAMSVSKSVTATATGIAIGHGHLAPTDTITAILPELAGTSFDGATIRHLLDMRTGTAEEILTDGQQRAYLQMCLWAPRTSGTVSTDLTTHYPTLRNDRPHGSYFQYRSILTCVLGWATERAAGVRLPQLVAQTLWQPMGAEFDAEITVDGHGNAVADIGFCCTLRDLARFGEVMRVGGRGVVPGEWVTDVVTPDPDTAAVFPERGGRYLPQEGAYYRDQWWVISPRERGAIYAGLGIHGQMVLIHEPAEVVIAKFSTWPDSWHDDHAQQTIQGCITLAERISG